MGDSKLTPAEKFDLANKNFKTVYRDRSRQHWKKYRFLHNWTLQKSKYLLEDERAYHGHKKVYKRGAIVNVDFGVNVGTELSGNHFAIILNKDDSPRNDKLTVIPLTSHEHPHSIKLPRTIRATSQNSLLTQYLNFLALTAALLYFREEAYKKLGQTPEEVQTVHGFLETVKKSMPVALQKSFMGAEILIEGSLSTPDKARELIKKMGPEIPGNQDPLSTEFINNSFKAADDFARVVVQYLNYAKTTYAKVSDVSTISKSRLRKINYYDPIGSIMVDNSTMDAIDNTLISLFTK